MARKVRILGAGLSGLSASINLALNGFECVVYERNSSVGSQINEDFQVLNVGKSTPEKYLKSLNLSPKVRKLAFNKAFFSTESRDLDLNLADNVFFIQRGGKDSLEYGLYRQAAGLGVKFKFKESLAEKDADIVAWGPRRIDAAAYGEVYETDSFDPGHFFMMYDDQFSPKGWYLYAVPYDGKLAVVNCASQPHVPFVKKLFRKAVSEKKILKDAVAGKKPVGFIGGFGNAGIPNSAVKDGRLYVGEAAGFQDPFRGFGMRFALESGKMAADSIADGVDYDALWRGEFMRQFKLDYSRRFFMSILGSRVVDYAYRNVKSGETISFVSGDVPGVAGDLIKSFFLKMEFAKRSLSGYW